MIGRRLFLGGLLTGLAAPVIVRSQSLMKLVVPKRHPLIDMEIGHIYSMSIIVDNYVPEGELIARPVEWIPNKPYKHSEWTLLTSQASAKDNGVYVVERESIVTPKQKERRKWQLQRGL